ncbi:hypothetical protein GCM10010289_43350 [Streptomyces violascens]|uniref:Uncharacterized protein n=1 Tax=Streptomyces violascens TaxID=67381 RepID=A0ABQ3QPA0_9ACTN|nr:hypothetical protein GCM10010289_43350 [Streptomyces violascens]GHI39070.1 hypothetical protein Sviol_34780 [Streptomyces violascens]
MWREGNPREPLPLYKEKRRRTGGRFARGTLDRVADAPQATGPGRGGGHWLQAVLRPGGAPSSPARTILPG